MKSIALITFAAAALLGSAAGAAPLTPAGIASPEVSNVDQVRMVCNSNGRCWRTRGPRYVQPGYDSYVARRSYNYYDGPRYYDRGYGYDRGYYDNGPSIGFSFGNRGW